jgi:hypothetical protein
LQKTKVGKYGLQKCKGTKECYKLTECPICKVVLSPTNTARKDDGGIRKDSLGREWCQQCTDEHDNIDWDEVNNSRLDVGL